MQEDFGGDGRFWECDTTRPHRILEERFVFGGGAVLRHPVSWRPPTPHTGPREQLARAGGAVSAVFSPLEMCGCGIPFPEGQTPTASVSRPSLLAVGPVGPWCGAARPAHHPAVAAGGLSRTCSLHTEALATFWVRTKQDSDSESDRLITEARFCPQVSFCPFSERKGSPTVEAGTKPLVLGGKSTEPSAQRGALSLHLLTWIKNSRGKQEKQTISPCPDASAGKGEEGGPS